MTLNTQEGTRTPPVISVLLSVRDQAELLRKTVDSILAQGWSSVEIILVEDGSSDDTAASVRAAYGDRVKVVAQPHAGLPLGSGEFLITLDSADLNGFLIEHSSILFRRGSIRADGALCDLMTFTREHVLAVCGLMAAGRFVPVRVPVTRACAVAGKGRQRRTDGALLESGVGPLVGLLRDPVVGGRFRSMREYLLGRRCRRLARAAYRTHEWSLFLQYFSLARTFSPNSIRSLRWLKRYLISGFMSGWSASPMARPWRRHNRRR